MSLGFNGLIADWYWMRSLQYVGRKVLSRPGRSMLDNLGNLDLKQLPSLLDTATTIDPAFIDQSPDGLASELGGGRVLHAGDWFVMVAAPR